LEYWFFFVQTLVAYFHEETQHGFLLRKNILFILVSIWAFRLSIYLSWRNRGVEDWRYKAFAKHYGKNFWWISLFHTFFLQAVINFIIGRTLLKAQMEGINELTFLDIGGIALWIIGFFFLRLWEIISYPYSNQTQKIREKY